MIEIGRICVKTAGRDAGLKCVIVEILDKNMVMIDGQTRRRKCNIIHLEPLDQVIKIKPKASHDEITEEFSKIQIEIKDKKPKQAEKRPRKIRKKKVKPAEELSKKVEKAAKKEEKPKKLEPKIPNSQSEVSRNPKKESIKKVSKK